MPSIVGGVKLNFVFSGGQVEFGDTFNLSPKSNSTCLSNAYPLYNFGVIIRLRKRLLRFKGVSLP